LFWLKRIEITLQGVQWRRNVAAVAAKSTLSSLKINIHNLL